jgi:hypothetical protein
MRANIPYSDAVVVSLHVEGFGGQSDETITVERAEWDAMTPAERAELLDDEATAHAADHVAWGWHIDNPDDLAGTILTPQEGTT